MLLKVIPYDITWGGRLKTDSEMHIFELMSITFNIQTITTYVDYLENMLYYVTCYMVM